MNSSVEFEHESFAQRHRGGALLERHGVELYVHPFLGFTLPPNHRSPVLNTDGEGFRLSDSPYGTVDSASWPAGGGGGLVLGNSVAFGLAASSDKSTPASYLSHITGVPQLNLAVLAAISLTEVVAAIPFLRAASTVVIIGGGPDAVNLMGSLSPSEVFGSISYERTIAELAKVPIFDLAELAQGKPVPDLEDRRIPGRAPTEWSLADAPRRMEAAADSRLRDLAFLSRAAGDGTRILFCLQPCVTPRTRDLAPEEKARYDFDYPAFGILNSTIEKNWDAYADRLAAGCAELGVPFLNLAADRFVGDSFADVVHMTDDGNRQAAQMIHRALEEASSARDTPGAR